MQGLKHENITKFVEYGEEKLIKEDSGSSKEVQFIAMELASGGELFDFISQSGVFKEDVARYYFL